MRFGFGRIARPSWRAWLIKGCLIAGTGALTGGVCNLRLDVDDDDFSIDIDDDDFDIDFKPIVMEE